MGKFDSYGGNFTPKGYMKVDAGGSHEENPNGGVQVGVDPQGVPNLLEEGEPVYNDYVYSDNIVATEEFLLKNNIPKKYAGRLYSEIADSLFAEYEERELDPISKNGADAMLTRLAQAQEEQKQYEQQKELEAYLKTLSPEDLQALDEQLAMIEQQGMEQMPQQPSEEEMIAMQGQQPMPQEVMQQPMPVPGMEQAVPQEMPMMARGGYLNANRFDGEGDSWLQRLWHSDAGLNPDFFPPAITLPGAFLHSYYNRRNDGEAPTVGNIATDAVDAASLMSGMLPLGSLANSAIEKDYNDIAGQLAIGLLVPSIFRGAGQVTRAAGRHLAHSNLAAEAGKIADDAVDAVKEWKKVAEKSSKMMGSKTEEITKLTERLAKATTPEEVTEVGNLINAAKRDYNVAKGKLWKSFFRRIGNNIVAGVSRAEQGGQKLFSAIDEKLYGVGSSAVPEAANAAGESVRKGLPNWSKWGIGLAAPTGAGLLINHEIKKNQARQLPPPPVSNTAPTDTTAIAPTVNPETGVTRFELYSAPKLAFGGRINRFDEGGNYTLPASYVIDTYKGPHINLPNFYLKDLLNGNNTQKPSLLPVNIDTTPALFPMNIDTAALTKEMEQNLSREPFFPVDINTDDITRQSEQALREADMGYFLPSVSNKATALSGRASYNDSLSQRTPTSLAGDTGSGTSLGKPYSTLGMYAPAFLGAAEGLWDVFQPIDRYRMTPVRAFEPEGKFTYEKQYYTPQDRNELINAILAQGNGLMGQIGNSGAGPSAPAAMIAADNQISQNAGKALWQGIMGNTQNKNTAIQANNQYGSIESQYNLMLDRARQAERARAQSANAQMAIPLQQLNYGAEGDYYAALQNQSQAVAQALADIARMKFAYNQINSDTSNEGYRGSMTGWSQYGGNNAKCGGHIKRKK